VRGGLAQAGWLLDAPAEVPAAESLTRLWASVPGSGATSKHRLELLSIASSLVGALDVLSSDPTVAAASTRIGAPSNDIFGSPRTFFPVDITYTCRRAGSVRLAARFHGRLRHTSTSAPKVELWINKHCSARVRDGLSVGTSADALADVVRDGVSVWSTDTAVRRVLPASVSNLQLFFTLGAGQSASQHMDTPRVVITRLDRNLKGGSHDASQPRFWKRRLHAVVEMESQLRRSGDWGLAHSARDSNEVLTVRGGGGLGRGGLLQAASTWPPSVSAASALNMSLECINPGVALVEIELAPYPAYQPYRPVVVSFIKHCGTVVSGGFDIATRSLAPSAAAALGSGAGAMVQTADADLIRDGGLVGHLPGVGAETSALTLHWRSWHDGLGAPSSSTIHCAGPANVSASLLATAAGEAETSMMYGQQVIHFECHSAGAVRCTLRLAWDALRRGPELQFRKRCGGVRHDVDIASDLKAHPVVLLQGQVDPSWSATPSAELAAGLDRASFTVLRHSAGDRIRLAMPSITISDTHVLRAHIEGPLASGGVVDSATGGGELQVVTECIGAGTSHIQVAVSFAEAGLFKPLSFAFTKTCAMSRLKEEQHHVAFVAFGFLMLGGALVTATRLCGGGGGGRKRTIPASIASRLRPDEELS